MDEQINQKPQHEHNCKRCVFLGRHGMDDLYFHDGGTAAHFTTLIARCGKDGDYSSGLAFSVPYISIDGAQQPALPSLAEARKRAIALGYGDIIAKASPSTTADAGVVG
jgi:hypothetical protein